MARYFHFNGVVHKQMLLGKRNCRCFYHFFRLFSKLLISFCWVLMSSLCRPRSNLVAEQQINTVERAKKRCCIQCINFLWPLLHWKFLSISPISNCLLFEFCFYCSFINLFFARHWFSLITFFSHQTSRWEHRIDENLNTAFH